MKNMPKTSLRKQKRAALLTTLKLETISETEVKCLAKIHGGNYLNVNSRFGELAYSELLLPAVFNSISHR